MQTFKIKKVKIDGISQYMWKVFYRGLFRYKPISDRYFLTVENAMDYIYRDVENMNCKIRVEDGD